MAVNLRLDDRLEEALREHAAMSGRSQQDIMREAIAQYLGLATRVDMTDAAVSRRRTALIPPRRPYAPPRRRLRLSEGVTSLDLLDREERL
jgi:hypothetical protein